MTFGITAVVVLNTKMAQPSRPMDEEDMWAGKCAAPLLRTFRQQHEATENTRSGDVERTAAAGGAQRPAARRIPSLRSGTQARGRAGGAGTGE